MSKIQLQKVDSVDSPSSNRVALYASTDGEIYAKFDDGSAVKLTYVDAEKVKIDADATSGYIGATGSDGVIRIGTGNLTYTDGGDFATLDITDTPTFDDVTLNNSPTDGGHATTKDYVDALVQGVEWQESVTDIVDNTATPPTEVEGDRYLLDTTAGGVNAGWDGASINDIVEFNGTEWEITYDASEDEGASVWIEDEDTNYTWNGTAWVKFGSTVSHNNLSNLGTGADHTYIDQDVTSGSSPTFDGANFTGVDGLNVDLDTTNFDNNLSGTDSDVQTAMETLDELSAGGGGTSLFECTVGATGADYTTIGAAVADGNKRILIIDDTTETGDIALSNGMIIKGISMYDVTVNIGQNSFINGGRGMYIGDFNLKYTPTTSAPIHEIFNMNSCDRTTFSKLYLSASSNDTSTYTVLFAPLNNWKQVRIEKIDAANSYCVFWRDRTQFEHIVTFDQIYYYIRNTWDNGFVMQLEGTTSVAGLVRFVDCYFYLLANQTPFVFGVTTYLEGDNSTVTFTNCNIRTNQNVVIFEPKSVHLEVRGCRITSSYGTTDLLNSNAAGNTLIEGCTIKGFDVIQAYNGVMMGRVDINNNHFVTADDTTIELTDSTSPTREPYINLFNNDYGDPYGVDLALTCMLNRRIMTLSNINDSAFDLGDVVVFDSSSGEIGCDTVTTADSNKVMGVVARDVSATDDTILVLTKGYLYHCKVDGTTDIAVGDYLGTSTTAGVAQKTTTTGAGFAMALEAYTADDANGVIKALVFGHMR